VTELPKFGLNVGSLLATICSTLPRLIQTVPYPVGTLCSRPGGLRQP
jgi:hypothetical protein